jgi:hypothetical protein
LSDKPGRPMKTALGGLLFAGALYLAAAAAFLLMLWTLLQVILWIFGAG